jgi:hypothetical protein
MVVSLLTAFLSSCSGPESSTGAAGSAVSIVGNSAATTSTGPTASTDTLVADEAIFQASQFDITIAIDYTSSERAVIDSAVDTIMTQCLSDEGFEYRIPDRTLETAEQRSRRRLQVLAFGDIELVSTYGYEWMTPNWTNNSDTDSSTIELPEPGPAENAAIDKCLSVVNSQLGGPGGFLFDTTQYLSSEQGRIVQQLQADTRLDDVRRSWTECMSASGYVGLSLTDSSWMQAFLQQTEVTVEERNTAVADYTCLLEVGYAPARDAVLRDLVSVWLTTHEAEVTEIRRVISEQVATAKEIIGG